MTMNIVKILKTSENYEVKKKEMSSKNWQINMLY